jgi:hypothetical protein
VHHVPAMRQKVVFAVGKRLHVEHGDVGSALRRIARRLASKFVLVDESLDLASRVIYLQSLRDVVTWAISARRVLRVVGPKAISVNGAPAPA